MRGTRRRCHSSAVVSLRSACSPPHTPHHQPQQSQYLAAACAFARCRVSEALLIYNPSAGGQCFVRWRRGDVGTICDRFRVLAGGWPLFDVVRHDNHLSGWPSTYMKTGTHARTNARTSARTHAGCAESGNLTARASPAQCSRHVTT